MAAKLQQQIASTRTGGREVGNEVISKSIILK
jgi:hypothetical protein